MRKRGRTKYTQLARGIVSGANDRNAVKEKANILCTIPEEEKAGATFLPNPLGGHVAALGLGKLELALLAAWAGVGPGVIYPLAVSPTLGP